MKKTDLFIIDAQNDFCDSLGSLYVTGADKDSLRLAEFIRGNSSRLTDIYITLDSHHNYDIAHPVYWIDKRGNHPDPFTVISQIDVDSGVWRTSKKEDRIHGENYVKLLTEKGKYSLCIWPPHCLIGSWGTQLQSDVFNALSEWEIDNLSTSYKIYKGSNSATEHYGALEAEIPQKNDRATLLRQDIVDKLAASDTILIAGQALDYCVANTVRQIGAHIGEDNLHKIALLEDCCSSVNPSSGFSDSFLKEMIFKGMKVLKSTEVFY